MTVAAATGLATTPDELRERMSRFSTPASLMRAMEFVPRSTDVFLATYPKCGTTLIQQIVHGLRTSGDMDFRDISEVIPWLEVAFDLGQDPNAEQRANPRAFKTHLDFDALPKGGRAIYLLRDPEAALVSFYHFFSGWFVEPGSMNLETFALDYVLSRQGHQDYWHHLVSWWPHREDENVLALCFEDVVEDMPQVVRRVATFLGLDASEELCDLATRQASIEFMQQSPTLWEDVLLREARNGAMGLPAKAGGTKVRKGETVSPTREISERVRATWAARWAEIVEPATGCPDYATLRSVLRLPE